MKLGEFKKCLQGWNDDLPVVVRISDPEGDFNSGEEEADGSYLAISDERSLTVESDQVVIIGDYMEPE